MGFTLNYGSQENHPCSFLSPKNVSGLGFLLSQHNQVHSEQQRALVIQHTGHYDSLGRHRWISHQHAAF